MLWFTRAEVERLSPDTVLLSSWDDDGALVGDEEVPLDGVGVVARAEGRTRNGG